MAFQIRRGHPGDAEFLAWVMLCASRGHLVRGVWDLMIGADDAGCLEYLKRIALAEPRSILHCESFLVAELDGRPAAALCGFEMAPDRWEKVAEAQSRVQRGLGWTTADFAASEKRTGPLWGCFLQDAGADWESKMSRRFPNSAVVV
jgi:hypothetical protein